MGSIAWNVTTHGLQGLPQLDDVPWMDLAMSTMEQPCVFLYFSYIVTGDIKGNIKFYDHTLSVVNWYSNFKLGAIRTLSFSKTIPSLPTEKSNLPTDCTLRGDLFVVR